MLQSIRDRTSGIVAGFVVALIVVPFAFWGVESFFSGGGDPVVAKVGDQKIHQSQFRRAYEQRYQQYVQLMGSNFRADQFNQAQFQQSVLDDMTQEYQMRQFAQDAGFRVGDGVLLYALSDIPAFQKDGKFDVETYKSMLQRQGLNSQRFEAQMRDSLQIDQMRDAVVGSAFGLPVEAKAIVSLAGQQRDLSYALFSLAHYRQTLSISDAEVQKYYQDHQSEYQAPERIRLSYVELSSDTLPAVAEPSAETLKALYESEKTGRFSAPEERKLSDLMINFGNDKAAALKKAQDLAARLKAGADFAQLAAAESDDPISKKVGGALGWFKRGQMPEANIEKALWALQPGQSSEPVETAKAWHLLHVDEVKAAAVKPFEDAEVQSELKELHKNREQQKQFQTLSEKLEQLAFENPSSLEPVAKALNLTVQTSEWFTRTGGTGIAAQEAVKQAAFSPEVFKDGENSKPLTLGDSQIVVVRKADYEAPRQKKFEEVAEAVRGLVRENGAKARAQADAQALLDGLNKNAGSLQDLAAQRGAEFKNLGPVRRDNGSEDRAVVDALFKLPHPKEGTASYGLATLGNGDVAVLAMDRVAAGDVPDSVPGAQMRQLQQLMANMEFEGYRKRIGEEIKVKIVNPPQADTTSNPDL
ncbi:peptidyl-prolyl cis-trans isomerase D [Solimonas aquatica]|uniref:Periplasmic chaperone PpiD n=1 Tax=Solimonas aquatica TaxID=489703 RepID=A0A1H9I074_9GAMM|nr:SurA N-terminal domain-containing protein [Solimonas aquatica]SEQ67917.1 peptidyl-prolyl cis-trans isomerase D [Solimonas aquatica]